MGNYRTADDVSVDVVQLDEDVLNEDGEVFVVAGSYQITYPDGTVKYASELSLEHSYTPEG